MRNIIIAIGLFFALCASALAETKPENTYEARSLNKFTQEYQRAYDSWTLDKFENTVRGNHVQWLGIVTDVSRTGNYFTFKPILSSTTEDFDVFVRAELKSGQSIATLVTEGKLVKVDGHVSSLGTSGAIVIAQRVCVEQKPLPENQHQRILESSLEPGPAKRASGEMTIVEQIID